MTSKIKNLFKSNKILVILFFTMIVTSCSSVEKHNQLTWLRVFFALGDPIIATVEILKTEKKDGVLYYKMKPSKEQKPKSLNVITERYTEISWRFMENFDHGTSN